MTTHQSDSLRRARRSFWLLVVVAVLASGSLSSALTAAASPATDLRVVGSGLTMIVSVLLAARVYFAVDRAVGRPGTKAISSNASSRRHHAKESPR